MAGRNSIVPDVVCRIAVTASAGDLKCRSRLRETHARDFKSKNGTRLLSLLVPLLLPQFTTIAAAADGSTSRALPPAVTQGPTAVPLPGAVRPPSESSAPPALTPVITQAPPAVPLPGADVPPSDSSAPPALPPFITQAPPAIPLAGAVV